MIQFKNGKFHLSNRYLSYVIEIGADNDLLNTYFGAPIDPDGVRAENYLSADFASYKRLNGNYQLGALPLEYPTAMSPDYRVPAFEAEVSNGVNTFQFKYKAHGITDGKPALQGMPAVYAEQGDAAQTLKITAEDLYAGLEIDLFYTVFDNFSAVCRHTEIRNIGDNTVQIRNAQSVSFDFPVGEYEYIHFPGDWAREKHLSRADVTLGTQGFESRQGASSHTENPFMLFGDKGMSEDAGNVYGISLIYSGNHKFQIESTSAVAPRVQAGINPFMFSYKLKAGECFVTPEAVVAYSAEGFKEISKTFHELYRTRLCRGKFRDIPRPILVNNWEGTYFNFNREKLLSIATVAADLGLELFVLDDGWFGKRNNDKAGLGDWYVNMKKLPGGIKGLAEKVNAMGLKFGLWVEPEMVNPDSDLYRAHPNWAVTTDVYEPSQGRNQLILDLTREDVREYIINSMTDVFRYGNIEYIKWDNNRHFSDVFSRRKGAKSGEFFHRYIMGLYEIWDTLTNRFPEILFEACSSGGNRFDLATFCYMPQCWTSDNTDPLDRIHIQSGTSYGYPQSVMTMHVAAAISFPDFRPSSIEQRFNVSAFGLLGYELDVTNLSQFDRVAVKKQIEYYKQHRRLLQYGEYSRIGDIFKDDRCMWQITSPDKTEAMYGYFVNRITPNWGNDVIKFVSLNSDWDYDLKIRTQLLSLKNFGDMINVPMPKKLNVEDGKFFDFVCEMIKLKSEKEDYIIGGDSLMTSGFKPKQPYNYSGYKFGDSRMILDNDSRMYYIKKVSSEE